ncbi:MAG: leucine-rich repeat domain-containing protein [Roseburia sp.]|nr:leucine-rich repeat domain-containing protein [Roseburia sp.]
MKNKYKTIAALVATVATAFVFSACGNGSGSQHNYVDEVVPPTCTEAGYTLHKCTDEGCDFSYTDTEVKALGHSYIDYFCERCGVLDEDAPVTDGLEYMPVYAEDGTTVTSYAVSGVGSSQIGGYLKISGTHSEEGVGAKSVVGIADAAFKDINSVKAIVLPSSCKTIGDGAFEGCTALESIVLPSACQEIGVGAFKGCTAVGDITFGNGLKTVREDAFEGCTALKSVALPSGVTLIERNAFGGCAALASAELPMAMGKTVVELDADTDEEKEKIERLHFGYIFGAATYEQNIQAVPSALKSVGIVGSLPVPENAFYGCAIESVDIVGAQEIGDGAFNGCSSLTDVSIGTGVSSIGDGAFRDCVKLSGLTVASGLGAIGDGAFENCVLFAEVSLPDSINSIGKGVFEGCTGMISVTMPFSFGASSDEKYFGYIFGAESYSQNGASVPATLKSVHITGANPVTAHAFGGCAAIENVRIGASVKNVGASAFENCAGLKNVVLETGLVAIGDKAFDNCSALAELTLGSGIKSVGSGAFGGCASLKTVRYNGTVAEFGATKYADKYSSPLAYEAALYINGHRVKYS